MLIVSRHAPTTLSVTFICLLLSSQRAQHRTIKLEYSRQWYRAGNQGGATTSLLGHVWVWQRNNKVGTVSFSFLLIVTRETEEWESERNSE